MDADKPKISINLSQNELTKLGQSTLRISTWRARDVAEKARKITESDDLNGIQPGNSERAKARWQNEGGGPAEDQASPLASISPNPARS